jgi:hypothetical protein
MARYGEAAVWAARRVVEETITPTVAWNKAVLALNPNSIQAAAKLCPRTTFLTLCSEGFVRGVPRGRYVNGRENAAHAVALARVLIGDSDLTDASTARLWKLAGGAGKSENDQVDVVVALSRAGLLVEPPARG